jgi:hypothetical protein
LALLGVAGRDREGRRDHPHALRPCRARSTISRARFHLQDAEMSYATGSLHAPRPLQSRLRGR